MQLCYLSTRVPFLYKFALNIKDILIAPIRFSKFSPIFLLQSYIYLATYMWGGNHNL